MNSSQKVESFRDCPECPEMVVIPSGSFNMGADVAIQMFEDALVVHHVTIKEPFSVGKTEVTQAQWKAIMGNNPSHLKKCGDKCPVEMVSWFGAQEFVKKLSLKTGKHYRLPSEAEWEYACRAGAATQACGGDDVDRVAWHGNVSDLATHAVAQKAPNSWGLYDMSGNVWEWVEDSYHPSYEGAPIDGSAWSGGQKRVIRGGSAFTVAGSPFCGEGCFKAGNLHPAFRTDADPDSTNADCGFRVVRSLP